MNLKALNSLTKYPSIPTYHAIGEKGKLQPAHLKLPDEPLYATEKIDGTNARIILVGDDFFIGSRENLLYAKDDRIGDPAMGIVGGLVLPATEASIRWNGDVEHGCLVVYGEFYGGKTTACKSYGAANGFRVFDIARFKADSFAHWMSRDPQDISRWRDEGGQPFVNMDLCQHLSDTLGFKTVPVVECDGPIPGDIEETQNWLWNTCEDTSLGEGPAEGVVVRNASRSFIAKLRHEDYRRSCPIPTKGGER